MAYTALYRKFRPTSFDEVKGQDAIVSTLKNQIKAERIGHAYLFTGTRGTGKTTVAKVFAKAVNCETPVDGNPCGRCPSCTAIQAGASMNVIEIDAASNNGVDNIREIREEVAYSPAEGRYKVYIIDEVHMLSIGAFNALLKTLEEPPGYVIFILATTEVHKIPLTILSRCQRYDFRRITIDTITNRLRELVKAEGVEAEEKALRYIAKSADGSMRDALSLLDQCIAFYLGKSLSYDKVLEVLGAAPAEVFGLMLKTLVAGDISGVIVLLEELLMQGREAGQLVTDFIWYLRNLLLLQSSDNMDDVLEVSNENLKLLQEEAKLLSPEELIRYIRLLSELSNGLRYASQKRILIEITLIKLCRPQMEENIQALAARISQLEKRTEQRALLPQAEPAIPAAAAPQPKKPPIPKAIPEDVKQAVKSFRSLLSKFQEPLKTYLSQARLSLGEGNQLLLIFENELAAEYAGAKEQKKSVEKVLSDAIGKEIEILVQKNDTGGPIEESYADLEKIIHMDIIIEE